MWRRASPASSPIGVSFDLAAVVDDDVAFRRWYDTVAPRVYAYLLSRTGSVSVTEELVQETFVEVIRHPNTFDGRSDPLPWVIGVARHRLGRAFRQNRLREARRAQLVRAIAMSGDPDPVDRVDDRDSLARAMAVLPPDQRAALMLRFVDDLTIREVAAVIGRTEDATESLIRRARQAFEAAYRGGDRAP